MPVVSVKLATAESYIAKPSWCFAVITRYFMPAFLARSAMVSALKEVGLNGAVTWVW